MSKNDITGDSLISKVNSDLYRSNYDTIFAKKKKPKSCAHCEHFKLKTYSCGLDGHEILHAIIPPTKECKL